MDLFNYELQNSAQVFTVREARAEYSRLRKIAQKRLARLGASEFSTSTTFQNWGSGFATLSKGASERTIRKALYDVARFLNLKTSSVSGARKARKQFVSAMRERGYTFINARNADEFGQFMKEVKKHEDYRGRDSEQLVELYKMAKQKNISPLSLARNYEKWLQNEKTFESVPRSAKTVDFDTFIERNI